MSASPSELHQIADPSTTAILVIDMQNDFCKREGAAAKSGVDISMIEGIIPRIAYLLEQARRFGLPIIFVNVVQSTDGTTLSPSYAQLLRVTSPHAPFGIEGTWGAELIADLGRKYNEPIVVKHRSGGFTGTRLHDLLQILGVGTVVVSGEQTQGCVEATVRQAADLDYYPVIVSDCTASFDRELHEAAMYVMAKRWHVSNSEQLAQIWDHTVATA